jgi:hypothetical protein
MRTTGRLACFVTSKSSCIWFLTGTRAGGFDQRHMKPCFRGLLAFALDLFIGQNVELCSHEMDSLPVNLVANGQPCLADSNGFARTSVCGGFASA